MIETGLNPFSHAWISFPHNNFQHHRPLLRHFLEAVDRNLTFRDFHQDWNVSHEIIIPVEQVFSAGWNQCCVAISWSRVQNGTYFIFSCLDLRHSYYFRLTLSCSGSCREQLTLLLTLIVVFPVIQLITTSNKSMSSHLYLDSEVWSTEWFNICAVLNFDVLTV